jgi:lipopolysaccharide transport system permease protein
VENTIEKKWDLVIQGDKPTKGLNFKELIRYKDLLLLFVKRDFISLYKQTILGPLWVVIQPILTTITFFIVFTKIAAVGTGGVPPILFYMLGVTVWTYLADCVIKTSDTFIVNQNMFSKVYFPRLIVPFSIVTTNLIKFAIQFALFLLVLTYFILFDDDAQVATWGFSIHLLWLPYLIVLMGLLGLGTGLIISALTTKYRDLRFLIQFGVQLAMYATPVVWPLKGIDEQHHWKVFLNPMTSIIETFKVAFFGKDFAVLSFEAIAYSSIFSIIVLIIGVRLFSRVEKSFMDTI